MAIEYGIRDYRGDDWAWDKSQAEWFCRLMGAVLIAREVSEPYVVSIRD